MQTASPDERNLVPFSAVSFSMWSFLRDVILPSTDRTVAIQWAVMTPFWLLMFWLSRKQSRDIRTFVVGLAMLNLAIFAARTVH